MTNNKNLTGVLLINLGTPDSPHTPDVRRYLREFLMDGRVIDIPYLLRFLLVQGIIAPFRAPKSSKVYKKIWTERGSPLMFHSLDLTKKLQTALGSDFEVDLGMRYQNPSIENALNGLLDKGVASIIIIPLFPQYASATVGSVQEELMRLLQNKQVVPSLTWYSQFHEHPAFIKAFAAQAAPYLDKQVWDKIVFSYHGIPERHIRKADASKKCMTENCCAVYEARNRYCYKAQCYQTTRLLASALHLLPEQYITVFQSRLGKEPWLEPYAEDTAKTLPSQGHLKVLTLVPSFVADCLETLEEVGEEYKEYFEHAGGKEWVMVPSLNSSDLWVDCLKQMVVEKVGS